MYLLTFLHQGPPAPGVDYAGGFPLAAIELAEQPGLRVEATVIGCPRDRLRVGLEVELTWIARDGQPWPGLPSRRGPGAGDPVARTGSNDDGTQPSQGQAGDRRRRPVPVRPGPGGHHRARAAARSGGRGRPRRRADRRRHRRRGRRGSAHRRHRPGHRGVRAGAARGHLVGAGRTADRESPDGRRQRGLDRGLRGGARLPLGLPGQRLLAQRGRGPVPAPGQLRAARRPGRHRRRAHRLRAVEHARLGGLRGLGGPLPRGVRRIPRGLRPHRDQRPDATRRPTRTRCCGSR